MVPLHLAGKESERQSAASTMRASLFSYPMNAFAKLSLGRQAQVGYRERTFTSRTIRCRVRRGSRNTVVLITRNTPPKACRSQAPSRPTASAKAWRNSSPTAARLLGLRVSPPPLSPGLGVSRRRRALLCHRPAGISAGTRATRAWAPR